MAFFDWSLTELEGYQPPLALPEDFATFWADSLAAARALPLKAEFERVASPLTAFEIDDVTFSGYGGHRIKAWYLRPAGVTTPLPCVVQYIGYGGGRDLPALWLFWPSAGYATLVMDTRGQGSTWAKGDTPDPVNGEANPAFPGFMTQGIQHPETYYYRRLFIDAARAVDAARSRPDVDAARVVVAGGSQGGALSLVAASLVPDVAACLPEVPFLCHFERAIGLTDADPYAELTRYLAVHREAVSAVYSTLRYFDGMHHATRIQAPVYVSTGLMDAVCPPSTVFAAYNHLPHADKAIEVYPFNGHEGGGRLHQMRQLDWLNARWSR